jgi:hypothetical protein
MNTLEIMKEIETKAQEINTQELRVISQHIIGKAVRQGDIYIHMVENDFEVGQEINVKQIVDGTSIGSRHILDGNVIVYEGKVLPKWVASNYPLGKAFDVKSRCIVTHPEHAHVELPKGRYVVTHQMDLRTLQKVSD